MTVRRGFLYLGVFLVAAGGVALLASTGALDRARVAEALTYWPIAVIAIGAALVLRHTSAAVPAGLLAAATPGLLIGGLFVSAPDFAGPCTDIRTGTGTGTPVVHEGSFGSSARVQLELSCGQLVVTTAPGNGWSVDAGSGDASGADVTATPDELSLISSAHGGRFGWNRNGDDWNVVLPTGTTLDLDAEINAGRGRLDLAGARLESLAVDVNAAEVRLDLTDATVRNLDVNANAAATTINLPATGDFTGELEVNAGSIHVCVPETLGLRVTSSAALGSIQMNGLTRSGDAWVTPGFETAQSRGDLTVSASLSSVDVNSQGACK